MKTIKLILFAILAIVLFTSCEAEDYDTSTTYQFTPSTNVGTIIQHEPRQVINSMKGHYIGYDLLGGTNIDEVIITEDIITIKTLGYSETIYVNDTYFPEGQINCYLKIEFPDGTILTLALAWLPETPNVRDILFIKLNDTYISRLELTKENK